MIQRIIPIAALVLSVVLFFGYINPTYSGDIATMKTQIKSYDAALTAAQQFTDKEAELTRDRAALPPDGLARLESFLPDSVDNIQLILDLDALGARSGVTLSNFDIGTNSAQGTASAGSSGNLTLQSESAVDSLDISLTATGSYSAFRSFLAGIEQSLRPLDVTAVSIHNSTTGVYTYDITIRIYWLH